MKQRGYFIVMFYISVSLVHLRCSNDNSQPADRTYGSDAYRIPNQLDGIYTEYGWNYSFLLSEKRLIYVYGAKPNYTHVFCYDQNNQQQDYFDLTNAPQNIGNYYYNTTSGEYTAPLNVMAPASTAGSPYKYKLEIRDDNGNTSSSNLTVAIISQRDYQIEYSCMTGYDIRTQGYFYPKSTDYLKPYRDAFKEANTTFKDPTIGDIAIDPTIVIDGAKIDDNDYLITLGDQFASDGSNHDPRVVVLFSVNNYSGNTTLTAGKTARKNVANGIKSYTFVFLKRCEDSYPSKPSDGDDIRVLKTRTAIHELTHGRRKNLSYDYYTDATTGGYDMGIYKDSCLVQQVVVWDPNQAFHLCDGHRQMLMNVSW